MLDDCFSEVIPESAKEWFAGHPRVLFGACAGLLVFAGLNFYRATELVVRARQLVADVQVAASEALGG